MQYASILVNDSLNNSALFVASTLPKNNKNVAWSCNNNKAYYFPQSFCILFPYILFKEKELEVHNIYCTVQCASILVNDSQINSALFVPSTQQQCNVLRFITAYCRLLQSTLVHGVVCSMLLFQTQPK